MNRPSWMVMMATMPTLETTSSAAPRAVAPIRQTQCSVRQRGDWRGHQVVRHDPESVAAHDDAATRATVKSAPH